MPREMLREFRRCLRPKGRFVLVFNPWGSPRGSHLSQVVRLPWCQLLFSRDTLEAAVAAQCRADAGRASTIEGRAAAEALSRDVVDFFRKPCTRHADRRLPPVGSRGWRFGPWRSNAGTARGRSGSGTGCETRSSRSGSPPATERCSGRCRLRADATDRPARPASPSARAPGPGSAGCVRWWAEPPAPLPTSSPPRRAARSARRPRPGC